MIKQSFIERVDKFICKLEDGCWAWTGASSKGRGIVWIDGGNRSARRTIYAHYYPENQVKGNLKCLCGNEECVNPHHYRTRLQYFESLIKINNDTGCHEWVGPKKEGYGWFSIDGNLKSAHRISFEIHKGPIPEKINVCHSCDNPSCVNPEHLWLGTQFDNVNDMMSKKRGNKASGESHHKAKITEDDVRLIRSLLSEGISMRHIQHKLNISYRIIQRVCSGQSWSHVE